MKTLARWASRYSSPYPRVTSQNLGVLRFFFSIILAVALIPLLAGYALAAAQITVGTGPDWFTTASALYGPACGVLLAVVILCERIARVIPNSTTNKVLKVLLVVTTIVGLKVPDNQ